VVVRAAIQPGPSNTALQAFEARQVAFQRGRDKERPICTGHFRDGVGIVVASHGDAIAHRPNAPGAHDKKEGTVREYALVFSLNKLFESILVCDSMSGAVREDEFPMSRGRLVKLNCAVVSIHQAGALDRADRNRRTDLLRRRLSEGLPRFV
jgi:hypothetical protein